MDPQGTPPPPLGLASLLGQQLSSVEFVQDYVQLHFDGPTVTAFTPPTVVAADGGRLAWGAPGYRDALCALIARPVERAELRPGEALVLGFDGGASVSVSLRPEDYQGPEAVMFVDGTIWWVT